MKKFLLFIFSTTMTFGVCGVWAEDEFSATAMNKVSQQKYEIVIEESVKAMIIVIKKEIKKAASQGLESVEIHDEDFKLEFSRNNIPEWLRDFPICQSVKEPCIYYLKVEAMILAARIIKNMNGFKYNITEQSFIFSWDSVSLEEVKRGTENQILDELERLYPKRTDIQSTPTEMGQRLDELERLYPTILDKIDK